MLQQEEPYGPIRVSPGLPGREHRGDMQQTWGDPANSSMDKTRALVQADGAAQNA